MTDRFLVVSQVSSYRLQIISVVSSCVSFVPQGGSLAVIHARDNRLWGDRPVVPVRGDGTTLRVRSHLPFRTNEDGPHGFQTRGRPYGISQVGTSVRRDATAGFQFNSTLLLNGQVSSVNHRRRRTSSHPTIGRFTGHLKRERVAYPGHLDRRGLFFFQRTCRHLHLLYVNNGYFFAWSQLALFRTRPHLLGVVKVQNNSVGRLCFKVVYRVLM